LQISFYIINELGRKTPTSTSQLLDIATNFASGEEAVGTIFSDGAAMGKQKAEAAESLGSRDPKKKKKGRKGKQGGPYDNLVAAADRKNPKRPPAGPDLFDEMLKKPCPYHRGLTKHTLEECTVLRRYYTDIITKEGAEETPKDDDPQGEGFPKIKNCLLIFGGVRLTSQQVRGNTNSEKFAQSAQSRHCTSSGPRARSLLTDRITRIGSPIPGAIL